MPIEGLSPVFTHLARVREDLDITPVPTIAELREGFYTFDFEPFELHYFVADGGASIADSARYIRGVIEPSIVQTALMLEEILAILRNDMEFVVEGGETYQVIKKDGQPF